MNSIRILRLKRRLTGLARAQVWLPLALAAGLLVSACQTVNTTQPGTVNITGTGTLAPGQSAGTLSTGALTLDPTTTLAIEIGGTAFANFDRVSVTGGISLDGTLSGSLINGFNGLIQPNDLFAIILNDGGDAVTGNLSDTAQGGLITFAGGQQFFISYTGNFDGAIAFTCAGSSTNEDPRLLRLIPHSATWIPEPNERKFDWMRLTSNPSPSAAQR